MKNKIYIILIWLGRASALEVDEGKLKLRNCDPKIYLNRIFTQLPA